jgi:hypothetical protein
MVLLLGAPALLEADTIDVVSSTWSNAVGGLSVILNQANDPFNDARWGTDIGLGQSGLGFDGVAPPAQVLPALGDPFLLGTLRHYNNPIAGGSAASSVDLGLLANMTIGGSPIATGPFNFRFHIDETPNVEPCVYPSTPGNPCADQITFENLLTSDTFLIGGGLYTISIVGFADTLGGPIVSAFTSQEGGTNDAYLYGAITHPVPEPASLTLLLLGGVVVASRRRARA